METRDDSRSGAAAFRLDLEFAGMRQFIRGFAGNLAEDGLFVPCDAPLAPSTIVRLRVILADEVILLEGTGVVFWSRTKADKQGIPGMAVRLVSMAEEFQHTIRNLLEARRRRGEPVLQLDRPRFPQEPRLPWEDPEVGYNLRVHAPGDDGPPAVRRLGFFTDVPEPAAAVAPEGGEVGRGREVASSRAPEVTLAAPATSGDRLPASRPAPADDSEEVPGIAFEVSFFDDDGSPDTTPRLDANDPGPEVTFGGDEDEDEESNLSLVERIREVLERLPPPRLLLEVAVILLLLWGTKTVVSRLATGARPVRPAATPTTTPTVEVPDGTAAVGAGDNPGTAAVTVGVTPTPASPAAAPPSATPTRTSTRPPPATATKTATRTVTPRPTRTPTRRPQPTAAPTPAPPAQLVVRDVSWRRNGRQTVIAIRADGPVDPAVVTVAAMSGPPRVLVRIRGVGRAFSRTMIQVGTAEVATIRVGFHPEERPPSLHIVLDLAGESATLTGQRIEGSLIELVIAS